MSEAIRATRQEEETKKLNWLYLFPAVTLLLAIVIAYAEASTGLTNAEGLTGWMRIGNILYGITGLITFVLALLSFYYGWKLRKEKGQGGYVYGPWAILFVAAFVGALFPVLGEHIFLLLGSIIGIGAKKILIQKGMISKKKTIFADADCGKFSYKQMFQNSQKLTFVAIALAVIIFGALFYWYAIRPSQIVKQCAEDKIFGGYVGDEAYIYCLRSHGIDK